MIYDPKVITDYIILRNKIKELFESGKLEYKQYAEMTGFKNRITFTKRVRDNSFSAEELLAIVNKINDEFLIK